MAETTKQTIKITRDTEVEVFNLFSGSIGLKDSNGNGFVLSSYGDSDWLTVKDIQSIKNESPLLIKCGALGIADADVLKFLRVEDAADGMIFPDELTRLVNAKTTTELEKKLAKMNKQQLANIGKVARDLAKEGMIDSANVRAVFINACGQPSLFE